MRKPRLLINTLLFPPDRVSTAYLYGDIAKHFSQNGWVVHVFTTCPHYNYDGNFNFESKISFLGRKSFFNGCEVFHCHQSKSKNKYIRGLFLAWFHFLFLVRGLLGSRFDIILTPSPLLTSGFLGSLVAKIRNSKSVYSVQEIYPDILIKYGKINSIILIRFLKWIEVKTYEWSHLVTTIDEQFSNRISNRLDSSKLRVIPNFVDTVFYNPENTRPNILDTFKDKYLVGYVGNIGNLQNWDVLTDAANKLSNYRDIVFILIGGGAEFDRLNNISINSNNIKIYPYVPLEDIPPIVNRINLHIICMNDSSDMDGLPSKVYTILACGKPILASTSSNSPLSISLLKSGNGIVVPLSDSNSICSEILSLYNNKNTSLSSEAGRKYVIDIFSKHVVLNRYINEFNDLLQGKY